MAEILFIFTIFIRRNLVELTEVIEILTNKSFGYFTKRFDLVSSKEPNKVTD